MYFRDGTNAVNLAGATPFMSFSTNAYSSARVTSSYSIVSSATGIVDFTFSAQGFNLRGGPFVYEAGIADSNGVSVVYRQGSLWLDPSPYSAGASAVSFGTNLNWASFSAYLNTADYGPYRAGTNITFSINSDGSASINSSGGGGGAGTITNIMVSGGMLTIANSGGPQPQIGLSTSAVVEAVAGTYATGTPVYVDAGLTNGITQGQTSNISVTNSGRQFYLTLSGVSTGAPLYAEADTLGSVLLRSNIAGVDIDMFDNDISRVHQVGYSGNHFIDFFLWAAATNEMIDELNAEYLGGHAASYFATGTPSYVDTGLTNGIAQGQTANLSITNSGKQFYVTLSGVATGAPLYVESDPVWTAASTGYWTKTQADARYVNEAQTDSVTTVMITNGAVTAAKIADGATLAEISDNDGDGSGLDADLLDGLNSDYFQVDLKGYSETGDFSTGPSASGNNSICLGDGNSVSADDAVTLGGYGNENNANRSALVSGLENNNGSEGGFLGAGAYNTLGGTVYNFLGGGLSNRVNTHGEGSYNSLVGGKDNFLMGDGAGTVLVGGEHNQVYGGKSFLGGGYYNELGTNENTSDLYGVLVGGAYNRFLKSPSDNSTFCLIGGGYSNTINGGISYSSIVGGYNNAQAGSYSYIGGGRNNSITGAFSAIVCGDGNSIAPSPDGGVFIGGGTGNKTTAASGNGDPGNNSSIVGGYLNVLGSESTECFIGGGRQNSINLALNDCFDCSIVGGYSNRIERAYYSAILGGRENFIDDSTYYASILSGYHNTINGSCDYSVIAGGRNIIAAHGGSFVFADASSTNSLSTTAANQFIVRAANVTLTGITDRAYIYGDLDLTGHSLYGVATSSIYFVDSTGTTVGSIGFADVKNWNSAYAIATNAVTKNASPVFTPGAPTINVPQTNSTTWLEVSGTYQLAGAPASTAQVELFFGSTAATTRYHKASTSDPNTSHQTFSAKIPPKWVYLWTNSSTGTGSVTLQDFLRRNL